MNSDTSAGGSQRELELEVEAEGREWMRWRTEEKLQAQVQQHGAISPPHSQRKVHHRRRQRMGLRRAFGVIALQVWSGKDPADGNWGISIRQRWGLSPHQQLSPALEAKLCYLATVTGTYEMAAQLARKTGVPMEDSTVRALVQRLGARADQQRHERLQTVPRERTPAAAPSLLAVVQFDGCQLRHRGPG